MKYVLEQVKQKENRQMLSVIRMEIDYELGTLFDAMQEKDKQKMIQSKEKLRQLVGKLKKLNKHSSQ